MKKNILLLINGFGIEQTDSYNVYSKEVMPNLDKLTTDGVFKTIQNNYLDYKSGYRNFSIGISEPLTYSLIENEVSSKAYKDNQVLKYIANESNKFNSKIHVFCYFDSVRIIEQLKAYLTELQSLSNNTIYLHLMLCQQSFNEYKDVERGFSSFSYELGNKVKLGIVSGNNKIKEGMPLKEFIKLFVTETGEKWKDLEKKVKVLIQTKTKPEDARPFAVNTGYMLSNNDQILLFNYSSVDLTSFKRELSLQRYREIDLNTIKYYSLFPITTTEQVPYMYTYAVSSTYFLNSLKTANVNCLVLDKKERCPYINYYFTGLRNDIDESLKFLATDDGINYDETKLIEVLNKYDRNLVIINYEIESSKTIEELKDNLAKIDKMIGILFKYATDNSIGFFISSLYGFEREMYNAKGELLKINFYSKVPLIFYDKDIDLNNYSISEGSLFDLSNTLIWNCNRLYKNSGIIKKKSSLLSIFRKKLKEVKKDEK